MLLTINEQRINQLTLEQIANYQQKFIDILDMELPSITQNTSEIKQQTGANNFTSLAAFYHADPNSVTGFPYIRIDGNRNPLAATTSDNKFLSKFYSLFFPCSILYHLTKSENYAIKAIESLQTFFINDNTKMNPGLTYSGIVIGDSMEDLRIRGAVIDTNNLSLLPDFIELIKSSENWTTEVNDSMVSWFDSLSDWFKTNPRGILQSGYSHNIKTSYVKQLCSYLCACGKEVEARTYLENNVRALLSAQIDSDGKQVLEMDRVKNRHYSNFNLGMLVELATMSNSLGINIWNYEDTDGRGSIKKAMKYLCYYYLHPEEWTTSGETANNPAMTRKWLQGGVEMYDDQVLIDVYQQVKIYNFTSIPDYITLPS
jgi:hypothetical protein